MVAAGSGHDAHQLGRRLQKRRQSPRRRWGHPPAAATPALGRDAGRAVVRVADASRDAPDRLDRRIGKGHAIGPERERLDEVRRHPKAAGDEQRDVSAGLAIEMCPRAGQRGDRWHAYVIPEQQRRRARTPAATVQNDVVGAGFEGEVDISLDVVSGELETDRDAARPFPDLVSEPPEVGDRSRRVERRRRDRILSRLEAPDFGDPLGDLGCREVPPVPVFAP